MKKLILAFVAVFAMTMQSHAEEKKGSFFIDMPDTFTHLMKAIAYKQPASEVRQLIAEGANVNAIDLEFLRHRKPVLSYALDRGTDAESVEIIKMLIEAGADVNEITYNRVQDQQVYGMMPLLTYATIYSSPEVVQMFVDAGAQSIPSDESPITFKKTALEIAQELKKNDVVLVLQKSQGADAVR